MGACAQLAAGSYQRAAHDLPLHGKLANHGPIISCYQATKYLCKFWTFLIVFCLVAYLSPPTLYCLLHAASCQLGSDLLLTFATPWSNFQCSLGDRLAVGRMTLDHATGVRILLPQPQVLNVICYPL
jgi:hypothetical protein